MMPLVNAPSLNQVQFQTPAPVRNPLADFAAVMQQVANQLRQNKLNSQTDQMNQMKLADMVQQLAQKQQAQQKQQSLQQALSGISTTDPMNLPSAQPGEQLGMQGLGAAGMQVPGMGAGLAGLMFPQQGLTPSSMQTPRDYSAILGEAGTKALPYDPKTALGFLKEADNNSQEEITARNNANILARSELADKKAALEATLKGNFSDKTKAALQKALDALNLESVKLQGRVQTTGMNNATSIQVAGIGQQGQNNRFIGNMGGNQTVIDPSTGRQVYAGGPNAPAPGAPVLNTPSEPPIGTKFTAGEPLGNVNDMAAAMPNGGVIKAAAKGTASPEQLALQNKRLNLQGQRLDTNIARGITGSVTGKELAKVGKAGQNYAEIEKMVDPVTHDLKPEFKESANTVDRYLGTIDQEIVALGNASLPDSTLDAIFSHNTLNTQLRLFQEYIKNNGTYSRMDAPHRGQLMALTRDMIMAAKKVQENAVKDTEDISGPNAAAQVALQWGRSDLVQKYKNPQGTAPTAGKTFIYDPVTKTTKEVK